MKEGSYWTRSVSLPRYPALEKNTVADVVIIGAGITGLLSAYLIAQTGRRVVILEKGRIGSGATHLTTAFLTEIIDTDILDLVSDRGAAEAGAIMRSHEEAITLIEQIAIAEKIDCDFERCANYIYANDAKEFQELSAEYMAMGRLGIPAILSRAPLPHMKSLGYIAVDNQAKFHPMKFIAGLLPALEKLGVAIFEETEAVELEDEDPKHVTARTVQGLEVSASWAISAAYEPFGEPLGLFFKKGMYMSYVIEAEIGESALEHAIYEDMSNPYHYFRIEEGKDADTIIIGGEDHRRDVPVDPEKNFGALEDYLKSLLVGISYSVKSRWSGPILEPADGFPLIGPYKDPRILYAAGFSGNGMTYAGIAGLIFKGIIEGKTPPAYETYRADRSLKMKSLYRKALDYGEELIKGAGTNIWRRKEK